MTAANPPAVDELAFPNLIRTDNEQRLLLNEWERWKDYLCKCSRTRQGLAGTEKTLIAHATTSLQPMVIEKIVEKPGHAQL